MAWTDGSGPCADRKLKKRMRNRLLVFRDVASSQLWALTVASTLCVGDISEGKWRTDGVMAPV